MKITLLILSLLFITIYSTKIYDDFWDNNAQYDFYDPRTFGINIYKDPCTPITYNTKFRTYVSKHIKCIGKWCLNKEWKCPKNTKNSNHNANCYHVEHIIDIKGPEFKDNYNAKQIAGNMVMAWGRWNAQIGSANKNYNVTSNEKAKVYGADMMLKVRNIIRDCINKNNNIGNVSNVKDDCFDNYSCECDDTDSECGCDCSAYTENTDQNNTFKISTIVLGTLVIVMVIIVIINALRHKKMIDDLHNNTYNLPNNSLDLELDY